MMRNHMTRGLCSLTVALILATAPCPGADLQAFGFGSLKLGSVPARGNFPLLVILYEMSTANSTRTALAANIATTMDGLFFNTFQTPSISGYYLENSAAAFSWQRAAVLGPVKLDANESATLLAKTSDDDGDGKVETGLDAAAGFSYLLGLVAQKTGYNFAQWDSNGDGQITQDELSVVVIGNNSHAPDGNSRAGANRPIGSAGMNWAVPGQSVTLRGQIASLDHHSGFLTIAHELSHSLRTSDLYGPGQCFSFGLTLLTCTIGFTDDERLTYYMDPWHRMKLGWIAPRIFTLGTGGVATISASQIASANTPIILYDPARGTNEFFIVEYRNNRVSSGFDHDLNLGNASVPDAGMAVWHVNPSLGNNPTYHEGSPNRTMGGNVLWNGMTPQLSWTDGTVLNTRLNPIARINGGRDLVIEWITASDTFVDFNYSGPESGTFGQPFAALARAVNAASHGGTLKFKTAGNDRGVITITKRLELSAQGGPVTFGK